MCAFIYCACVSAYLSAYEVLSNQNEPQAIWFDNSELKSLPEAEDNDDVILIDDDNDNDGNSSGIDNGTQPSDNNSSSSSGEQKLYTCKICHSKLSSSYNLKRHHMIHTGEFLSLLSSVSKFQGFFLVSV